MFHRWFQRMHASEEQAGAVIQAPARHRRHVIPGPILSSACSQLRKTGSLSIPIAMVHTMLSPCRGFQLLSTAWPTGGFACNFLRCAGGALRLMLAAHCRPRCVCNFLGCTLPERHPSCWPLVVVLLCLQFLQMYSSGASPLMLAADVSFAVFTMSRNASWWSFPTHAEC